MASTDAGSGGSTEETTREASAVFDRATRCSLPSMTCWATASRAPT